MNSFQILNSLGKRQYAGFRSPFSRLLGLSLASSVVNFSTHNGKVTNNLNLLHEVRNFMKQKSVDAIIVPTDDPHMSEYVAPFFGRREFISGFSGSAGTVIITHNESLLFTDGRYHRQAELELSQDWVLMKQGLENVPTPIEYLSRLPNGSTIGLDPSVHSIASIKKMTSVLNSHAIKIKFLENNLIDIVWSKAQSRPEKPNNPVKIHPLQYAGKSAQEKLIDVRKLLTENSVNGLVISALDEIMWLFNIRGNDVPCNPVAICYAIVTKEKAHIFIDKDQVPVEVGQYFEENKIEIHSYEDIFNFIEKYQSIENFRFWCDPATVNAAIFKYLNKENYLEKSSPIVIMKACKNSAEILGMRNSHVRDGAAVVEFLSWLEEYLLQGNSISEYDIDLRLTAERAKDSKFLEPSFSTIAGVNENGAIIHYRAAKDSCKILTRNDMLLLDSGGQYLDGTTDVTRTLHFGNPTAKQSEMYTRVLKGHIAIDRQIFPAGTSGVLLDSFARQHLWMIGLNYNHGTGHGVGAALNVHEGPQRISPHLDPHAPPQPLLPGMIVSNEPGYYEVNGFGIRIENLLLVEERKQFPPFAGKSWLGFNRLTFIPIQKKMINQDLLTKDEILWINSYHQDVYEKVFPLLRTDRAKLWLRKETLPL